MDEMFADPQVRHLGMAQPVNHHARGDIEVVGQPLMMSRTPPAIVSATPDPGDHTDEILREIGVTDAEIEDLRAAQTI